MNNEIKMSTYFDSPVEFIGDTIECPNFAYATTTCEWEVNGIDYGHAIAHAINNHDRLVEENQRLTAIATKQAERANELYVALGSLLDAFEKDATEDEMYLAFESAKAVYDKSRIEVNCNDA